MKFLLLLQKRQEKEKEAYVQFKKDPLDILIQQQNGRSLPNCCSLEYDDINFGAH
jgi:hypothetical protein